MLAQFDVSYPQVEDVAIFIEHWDSDGGATLVLCCVVLGRTN